MEKEIKFEEGTILVTTKVARTDCGHVLTGANAFVKAEDNYDPKYTGDWVCVERKKKYGQPASFMINVKDVRLATEEEIKMFESGSRHTIEAENKKG